MTPSIHHYFSDQDLRQIQQAVSQAESQTSGEIVPYIVKASDNYEVARWRLAFFKALLVHLILDLFHLWTPEWTLLTPSTINSLAVLAGLIAFMAGAYSPALTRLWAGKKLMDQRVSQRAAEAFIEKEVFKTRHRTGILLFISLLEHEVLVVGDSGINARVKTETWHEIVDLILQGIRNKKPVEGLINAIHRCGALLEEKGFQKHTDDTNELSDAPHYSKD